MSDQQPDAKCPNCGQSEEYYPEAAPVVPGDLSTLQLTGGGHCLHCGYEKTVERPS